MKQIYHFALSNMAKLSSIKKKHTEKTTKIVLTDTHTRTDK